MLECTEFDKMRKIDFRLEIYPGGKCPPRPLLGGPPLPLAPGGPPLIPGPPRPRIIPPLGGPPLNNRSNQKN